jgi:UDP-N-acetylglucosamine acyltransferase
MPNVHSTATIEGEVTLADDVVIGSHCVLDGKAGPIAIGHGTRLLGNIYLTGPLTLGENNSVYPFACLGFAPQDLKWDPSRPGAGVVIGNGNTFRECVSIHRATSDETPTRIGDENYWMATSHAGHDVRVGNNCIFANGAALGGSVRVYDRVVVGGATVVHQFCQVGRGCMLSGAVGASLDLPPFFMLTGINVAGSINLVGMRRMGMSKDEIEDVRWVYKTLYRRGLSMKSALDELRQRSDRSIIREYIEFIESSKRGICSARAQAARSTG